MLAIKFCHVLLEGLIVHGGSLRDADTHKDIRLSDIFSVGK